MARIFTALTKANNRFISLAGGSISNICGLNVARFKKFPRVKAEGMQALPKLCIFTSEHVGALARYSLSRGRKEGR